VPKNNGFTQELFFEKVFVMFKKESKSKPIVKLDLMVV
jgi:hypothetical protein